MNIRHYDRSWLLASVLLASAAILNLSGSYLWRSTPWVDARILPSIVGAIATALICSNLWKRAAKNDRWYITASAAFVILGPSVPLAFSLAVPPVADASIYTGLQLLGVVLLCVGAVALGIVFPRVVKVQPLSTIVFASTMVFSATEFLRVLLFMVEDLSRYLFLIDFAWVISSSAVIALSGICLLLSELSSDTTSK